ncbi:MAG: trehalose-6-phosphate synthase, partial [Chloroflexota bacterium]
LQPWRFDPRRQHLWAEEYRQANASLVGAAAEVANASVFLLQDYHLYLAPALLRRQRPEAPIAHFSHIPWPRSGTWARLAPELLRGLLQGLLGADLLGFQTAADAANFAATCVTYGVARQEGAWLRGADGRATLLRNYPVTVDAPSLFNAAAMQGESPALCARSRQVVLRVDRLDPSKNIPGGFAAFGRLLEVHPELRGGVEFVAHLVRTRENVPEYRDARDAAREAAEHVNARFGTAGWQPIRITLRDDRQLALAELRRFDVLLANSLADGMNLVAKEGAVLNERDGVLVLSQRAGAWEELGGWALGVDPTDIDQTARVLHEALTMPPSERVIRARRLRHAVASTSSVNWLNRQVHDALAAHAANVRPTAADGLLARDLASRHLVTA